MSGGTDENQDKPQDNRYSGRNTIHKHDVCLLIVSGCKNILDNQPVQHNVYEAKVTDMFSVLLQLIQLDSRHACQLS
jgi:hypothetical protein